jgi:hypothetical protein
MSKFREVAEKLKAEKLKLEACVEDLDKEIDHMASYGNTVIGGHRAVISEVRGGLDEMKEMIDDLRGNNGGEDDKVAHFPDKARAGG